MIESFYVFFLSFCAILSFQVHPKKVQKKKKGKTAPQAQEVRPKDFLDLIAPAAVKFNTDHYICGSMYHCTLALRSYPATTEELALLRHLGGEKRRHPEHLYQTGDRRRGKWHPPQRGEQEPHGPEQHQQHESGRHRRGQPPGCGGAHRRHAEEPGASVHCAVYIDLAARDPESLRRLREEVTAELVRSKLGTDQLLLAPTGRIPLIQPHGPQHFQEPV